MVVVGACDVREEAEGAVFSLEKALGRPLSSLTVPMRRLLGLWSQALY